MNQRLRLRPDYVPEPATPLRRRDVVVCERSTGAALSLVGTGGGHGPGAGLCLRPAHPRHIAAPASPLGQAEAGGGALVHPTPGKPTWTSWTRPRAPMAKRRCNVWAQALDLAHPPQMAGPQNDLLFQKALLA